MTRKSLVQHDAHVEAFRAASAPSFDELLDLAPEIATPRSVVAVAYKVRYAGRALTARKPKEVSKKAAARCNGDWLAFTLAKLTLDDKNQLNVPAFEAILSANGVKHEHWNRTTKGWQGRLRMTGRLALQRVVAEADGELELPSGERLVAPRTWVQKHAH